MQQYIMNSINGNHKTLTTSVPVNPGNAAKDISDHLPALRQAEMPGNSAVRELSPSLSSEKGHFIDIYA